ncbi:MAG: hypothetical protein K0U98_14140 [Deltaproteobacteria bacterium]|nr:hypothetical protein [Deltaproteobacteria bacterium]
MNEERLETSSPAEGRDGDNPDQRVETPPDSVVGSLLEILQHPIRVAERCRESQDSRSEKTSGQGPNPLGAGYPLRLATGALVCFFVYGLSAGFFQGYDQVLLSAFKVPLILVFSLLLCAPSFYIFSSLSGAALTLRGFSLILSGFGALLGLLLIGFLPISWLFTVSSRSLLFLVFFHLLVWFICLVFADRFLGQVLKQVGGWNGRFAWLLLLLLVSLQMTTFLRPVLWRPPDASFFQTERMSFFEHLGQSAKIHLPKMGEVETE